MKVVVVTHSHLDREWYRTAEQFRARLVDAIDAVLDHIADDPGFVFTLDGQTIVLEDYLVARPDRRADVVAAVQAGRLVIGPWYVQADGFIPAAELVIRNLLEGRAASVGFGPMSTVAYLPDTFGHPAGLPTLLAGAGIAAMCHGRGSLPPGTPTEYRWEGPDGSAVLAINLPGGYHNAANLPDDDEAAAAVLRGVVDGLAAKATGDTVLLMAGHDHVVPRDISAALDHLAATTGAKVVRGAVDDVGADYLDSLSSLAAQQGDLRLGGSRVMLEGVWSTRIRLKLANARAETALVGVAEPLAALALAATGLDERARLGLARRELLANHAHDSLCGTSIDPVHREMAVRFQRVDDICATVAERALGELTGAGAFRPTEWDDGVDLAVFNPNPHPVSGAVQWWFDADPPYAVGPEGVTLPPLLLALTNADGLEVDGRPARILRRPNDRLFAWRPDADDKGIEFVVTDLPALGWSRVRVTTAAGHDDIIDNGRDIGSEELGVNVADDGTFTITRGGAAWPGLFGLRDEGDAGDSYDIDPVEPFVTSAAVVQVERRRHGSGIERLTVTRSLAVPVALDEVDRTVRIRPEVALVVVTTATLAPGAGRVDVAVRVMNTGTDHRLRFTFLVSDGFTATVAGGTGSIVERPVREPLPGTTGPDITRTFPAHDLVTVPGWGMGVSAPGIIEWEGDGDQLLATVVRSVGYLSRDDLRTRPAPLGPNLLTPEAQEHGEITAQFSLLFGADAAAMVRPARAAAQPALVAAAGDNDPASYVSLSPAPLVLSTLKPADNGDGVIVRVWNPSADDLDATLRLGVDVHGVEAVSLLEDPVGGAVSVDGRTVTLPLPAHSFRSIRLRR